ncbi:MAG: response regulator transcription factor [Candidatus Gracilibacteria bacterium]|nr:response regulator transcription factor [Candidatus Gracilibacteria bacterium]
MLTARSGDKINGLELGADEYISKPFSPRELIARIKSLTRRIGVNNLKDDIYEIENIKLDIHKTIVIADGKEISFTKNEFDILHKLLKEDGNLVERETLMKDIIGYENYAFDRTIDTHIKNIRKKINNKDLILTIRGKGYRINK